MKAVDDSLARSVLRTELAVALVGGRAALARASDMARAYRAILAAAARRVSVVLAVILLGTLGAL